MAFPLDGYPMKRDYSAAAASGQTPDSHSKNNLAQDEIDIARFGKKQQLRVRHSTWLSFPLLLLELINAKLQRGFGLVSVVGLTCTLMITWEGSLT